MKKIVAGLLCAAVGVFALSGCTNLKDYYIYTNIPSSEFTVLAKNYHIEKVIPADNGFSDGKAENTQGFTSLSKVFKDTMNTDAVLTVAADFSNAATVDKFEEFSKKVKQTLEDIEKKSLSVTNENSCAYKFNSAEAGETVEVDKTFYEVLSLAVNMYEFTQGYYNPAVYYSVCAYGFDKKEQPQKLPQDGDIEKYVELSEAFKDIEFTQSGGGYFVKKPAKTVEIDGKNYFLKVDLGGIGKGYATDIVNGMFSEYGFEYGLFNFGSSSIALKKHYKKGDYTLELIEPRRNSAHYISFPMHDICVSSSGDYENYYTVNGVRYCHIIDPTTGKPVQTGIMTATVAGGSAAENDAITTAIMAMGKDKAISFIEEKLTDRYAVFTYDKG